MSYSIGSSIVMMLRVLSLSCSSAAYNVVVLPEPVGPVTSRMPYGLWIRSSLSFCVDASRPRETRLSRPACLSSRRNTTRSPWPDGMVETRTSTARPAMRRLIRPSCGRRFSAMSSFAMTLMRETTSGATPRCLDCSTSRRMPSTRKRTTSRFSNGSTWMSEAFSRIAWVSTALMRRMIGASSSLSSRSACSGSTCARCARSVVSSSSICIDSDRNRLGQHRIDETDDRCIIIALEQIRLLGQHLRQVRQIRRLVKLDLHRIAAAAFVGLAQQIVERIAFHGRELQRQLQVAPGLGQRHRRGRHAIDTIGDTTLDAAYQHAVTAGEGKWQPGSALDPLGDLAHGCAPFWGVASVGSAGPAGGVSSVLPPGDDVDEGVASGGAGLAGAGLGANGRPDAEGTSVAAPLPLCLGVAPSPMSFAPSTPLSVAPLLIGGITSTGWNGSSGSFAS